MNKAYLEERIPHAAFIAIQLIITGKLVENIVIVTFFSSEEKRDIERLTNK